MNRNNNSADSTSRSSGLGIIFGNLGEPSAQTQKAPPQPPPHHQVYRSYRRPHGRPRSHSLPDLRHPSSHRSRHPWEPPDDENDGMALFPSFLADLQPNNSGLGPRQMGGPQNPQQQQQQQQQSQSQQQQQQQHQMTNGINSGIGPSLNIGGGGGAAGGGPTGINVYPTAAGHQLDLNYLWQQVQELSAVLHQNREATQGIIRSVVELQRRAALAAAENGGNSGEISIDEVLRVINENTGGNFFGPNNNELATNEGANNPTTAPTTTSASTSASTTANAAAAAAAATIADLRLQNQTLTDRNAYLTHEVNELTTLLQAYEAGLGRVLELVRNFSHENTAATLAIHRNYNDQLAAERQTNLELRQEYIDFQARLVNLGGVLRDGLRYAAENDSELREIEMWAALRHENRVLRRLVGLPVDDSDDGNNGNGNGEDTRQRNNAPSAGAGAGAATGATTTTTITTAGGEVVDVRSDGSGSSEVEVEGEKGK